MTIQEHLAPPAPSWGLVVVDPCAFGRAGLAAALSGDLGAGPLVTAATLSATRQAWHTRMSVPGQLSTTDVTGGCLVIRMPASPRATLALLLELSSPSVRAMFARWVTVLLTPVPAPRVRGLLAAMGGDLALRVVDDRQSVAHLRRAVLAACRASTCTWGAPRPTRVNPGRPTLSARECRILLLTLQGMAIADLARREAISHKTLYSRRHHALLKLGVRGMQGLLLLFSCTHQAARP